MPRRPIITIGRNTLGGKKLLFILGPCVIESATFTRRIARKLKAICEGLGAQFVFKASYDKANRTSVSSFRGTNVRDGCKLLGEIGSELDVAVTTDVHSPDEVEVAREYIDLLQIPAFLCRQTDLVLAAGASGRVVNVKKGQFLAPWDVKNVAAGCDGVFIETHEKPAKALSDGPNQIPLRSLPSLLNLLTRIRSEVAP